MVKCIVFDLDNTIWDGTLDANDDVKLNSKIYEYIKSAFQKGIVLAVASKNNYEQAYEKILEIGIEKYFYKFYISWDDKYKAINDLAKDLNISAEHILFIDDSEIELTEALYYIPELQILNVKEIDYLKQYINNDEVMTEESKNRNKIYKILEQRKKQEEKMSKEEFLKYCKINIDISIANAGDFNRIQELLSRTNQMNLNNKILNVEALNQINTIKEYSIYVIRMKDIFADYGIVGTTIIKENKETIEIQYFAISCKVEGRNIGKRVIEFIKEYAKEKNKNIEAKYIYNFKNEKLQALFVLNGFILDDRKYYYYNFSKNNEKNCVNKKDQDEEIKAKVRNIIQGIGKKNYDDDYQITKEFDSLMFIALVVSIEREFGIEIDLTQIDIKTFSSIKTIAIFVETNY